MNEPYDPRHKPVFVPAKEPLPARPANGTDIPSQVILFNDEVHTFEDVILQLMKAIACTAMRGYLFAYEVHNNGKANVYNGPLMSCMEVADVLREINLRVEIQPM